MKKSDLGVLPEYFDRYISLSPDLEIIEALELSFEALSHLPLEKWSALGDKVYAPGKWTIKEVLQHIIDTERIFTYRALCLARKDFERKPSFDENAFAEHAETDHRSFTDLLNELKIVRQASIALFQSFDEATLSDQRTSFENGYTVLAIGFILIGHQQHHLNILEERYYPVLDS